MSRPNKIGLRSPYNYWLTTHIYFRLRQSNYNKLNIILRLTIDTSKHLIRYALRSASNTNN